MKLPKKLGRLSLLLAVFAMVLLGSGLWLMTRLADIASWGFSKAVPGAVLDLKQLEITSLNHLVAGQLVIRDKKSGEELLKMKGGTATFSFQGLLKLQIAEIRFVQPVISISPRLLQLFSSSNSLKKSGGRIFPIGLTRVVCEEGNMRMGGLGETEINAKFSFDLHNLAFGSPQVKQSVILWAISAKSSSSQPFVELDRMEVIFSLGELAQSHLDRVRIQGGKLIVGKPLRALVENSKAPVTAVPLPTGQSASLLSAWTVSTINIFRVTVALEEENPGMAQIHFQLTTLLKDITLGDAANNLGSALQTVQLSNIFLPAPSGRKVMSFPTVFVRFTLQDLLRKQIEEVVVLDPSIYLNEDLFAYMDSISRVQSGPSSPISDWVIHRLRVDFGNLIIGGNEEGGVGLPVKFETDIYDISLQNLAALKINAQLRVPEENYEFSSYQLEFTSKSGQMHFSYPPEKQANNVVTVLQLSNLRWRQYLLQDPWIGVTFDRRGINGTFGGKAYSGYISGGFSFLFGGNSPWSGWIAGKKMDLSQLTKVISPENFIMTGLLNLNLQINAHGPHIERLKGSFQASTPGKMHIGKIESLLQKLPTDWTALKRSAATIALETLQDFEYQKVLGDFWFVESQGILNFNLSGPTSSRKFKFVLHTHPYSSSFWNSTPTTVQ